jgi:hypothetical protein
MAAGSVRKRRRGRSNTRQQGSNSTKLQGCDNKCKRFKNPRKIYTEQEPRARQIKRRCFYLFFCNSYKPGSILRFSKKLPSLEETRLSPRRWSSVILWRCHHWRSLIITCQRGKKKKRN